MNKTLFLIIISFIGIVAQAQKKKNYFKNGDVLIESNFHFSSSKQYVDDSSLVESKQNISIFFPKVGFFISNKFLFGLSLNYSRFSKQDEPNTPEEKKNELFTGIYGRYYFLEAHSRFNIYSDLSWGITSSRITDNIGNVLKTSGFRGDISLGTHYFISDKIAVNFTLSNLLNYTNYSPIGEKRADFKTEQFDVNINNFNNFFDTATFGLTFKL